MMINARTDIPRRNGIIFIRYVFAYFLIVFHYHVLSGYEAFWIFQGGHCVKAFFILTGFLTIYSYSRYQNAREFARRRIKRLLPSYIFVIFVCFAGGALISEYSAYTYFTLPQTYRYLLSNLSFLNFIEPDLPGVFSQNLQNTVNGSLWTMKVDIMFYLTVPLIFVLLKKYPQKWIFWGIFILTVVYNGVFDYLYQTSGKEIYLIVKRQLGGQYIYFLAGMTMYYYYPYLHHLGRWFFPLAGGIYYWVTYYGVLEYISAFLFAYFLTELLMNEKILGRFSKLPNITYGLFLYHFPVIQLLLHYRIHEWNFVGCLLLVLTITTLLATLNYKLIEKHIN